MITELELDNALVLLEKVEGHFIDVIAKKHIPANVPDILSAACGSVQKALRVLQGVD